MNRDQLRSKSHPLRQTFMGSLITTKAEIERRDGILQLVREFIRTNQVIRMGDERFAGTTSAYCYFFEGEDDLLHVCVARSDGEKLAVEEAQEVMSFLTPDLPAGVVWLKPGEASHHFYFGHDELTGI